MTQADPAAAGSKAAESEVGSVFVSNYPPFSFWDTEGLGEVERVLSQQPTRTTDLGLYLHIPFCRKRCKFCYFRVYTDKNFDEIGSYLEALATEVEAYAAQPAIAGRKLRFIYFGGGTPSYISAKQLRVLVGRLRRAIPWDGVEEVTFECEPGTLTRAKLEAIKEIDVTRLSLGIENFDDEILRVNGRAHVSNEIDRCLPWIDDIGFDQLNVDLIAGMVGETWEKWRRSVERTVGLAPDSVTVYQMELPFNTRFTRSVLDGSLDTPLADWDTKRAWHLYAIEELEKAGYEISSGYTMVRDRASCRFVYRDSLWRGCDLLGTGVASFSHLAGVHFQNVDGWGEYLATVGEGRPPLGRAFATSADERLTRELILQLKLGQLEGDYFQQKFGVDVFQHYSDAFERLENRGVLERGNGSVRLTRDGLLSVDLLLPEFYEEKYRDARYT